ncbi:spore germination protein [Paenibacillus sp. GSMTC-2017]|uniref:spore germination protein n=1 Tax=Paenibacillus sp. GSMTC-2017 TaxID=2794350 RepID=UPI0018D98C07|nr:spore germination protein [Paenibacillus sp. GSMTC-2017]MBH5316734.1 spore germination protein [Paenibacillus sp. GSMTC-2017]
MSQTKKPTLTPLSPSLKANTDTIHKRFGGSCDLVIRLFQSDAAPRRELGLLYIDGLVNADFINNSVLEPLMSLKLSPHRGEKGDQLIESFRACVVSVGGVRSVATLEEALQFMTDGFCLILAEGSTVALMADVNGGNQRAVNIPQTQTVIRGPQQGLVEDVHTNISLVRRIIRSPDLHVQMHKIGTQTHSNVAVMYLNGVADEGIVREVYRRLAAIDIDGVLESGYIEEFIQDETFTLFPTLLNTERPDTISASLLEGRVAILVDGTPMALIAPTTFFSFFQSAEDYYQRFDIATFVRIIRYVAYVVSMLLPALYIAVTTYHQEMLPTTLLISLAAQREGVPFPGLIEALLMEMTFEVLREAGLRMPRAIGPAISIVGALVLGQSAVQAGIVSAGMVIVVSFTAISNFVMPEFNMAATSRIIRFGFMLMAGMFGFFGIFVSVMFMLVHLVSLRSFGVPYMSPMAPGTKGNGLWHDVFVRIPWWAIMFRPLELNPRNSRRQRNAKRPPSQRHSDK